MWHNLRQYSFSEILHICKHHVFPLSPLTNDKQTWYWILFLFWGTWWQVTLWNCANIGLVSALKIILFVMVNIRKRWQKKQDNYPSMVLFFWSGHWNQAVGNNAGEKLVWGWSCLSYPFHMELATWCEICNSCFPSSKRARNLWAVNHNSRKTFIFIHSGSVAVAISTARCCKASSSGSTLSLDACI